MATESPLRLIGSVGAGNWPVNKDSAVFPTSSGSLVAEELALLLEGHKYHGNLNITGPSRSGSAPPSMEGSRAALDFLKAQQSSDVDASLQSLTNAAEDWKSEEQLRSHPAYLAYYCANVNLNPRLPPPLISRENRHLVHHVGGFGNYRKLPSLDDSNKVTLFTSRPALSTHKEESEDDNSPRMGSSEWLDKTNTFSGQLAPSLQGRNKNFANLIQEDYPQSSSPILTHLSQSSSHIAAEDANPDSVYNPGHDSAVDTSKQEFGAAVSRSHPHSPDPSFHSVRSKVNANSASGWVPCSISSDKMVSLHQGPKVDSSTEDTSLHNVSPSNGAGPNLNSVVAEMKNLKIYTGHKSQPTGQHPHQVGLNARGTSSQAQIGQTQLIPQGVHNSQNTSALFSRDQSKLSSADAQQVLQSTAINPPFYAATAAYGTPYYPNLQPPSLFSPQFGIGGYALNTSIVPSYITGYPPNYPAISVPVENPVNPNFSAGASGVSSSGTAPDMQQINKIYGQLGVAIQPSFADQLYIPYFQHPSVDAFVAAGQYSSLVARGSSNGSPLSSYDPQKGPAPPTYLTDQRPQVPRAGNISTFNARKGGIATSNYYANPPNLGVFVQYANSSVASPVFQGSPASGASFSGRRNENFRYPSSSGRSAGLGWQGQRGRERVEDPKSTSFLEELKSNKARRYELSDITGRIVEFSADQHGSRFIQQKLEACDAEEKALVFKEVLPHASILMIDVFGNYVIQKFFEHGTAEQRKELANKLAGNILSLSLQMYGCRVIQKALEVIELDQKTQLVQELDGHVMRCVRDQNGNHVIQKCIECMPTEKIGFIISAFHGQVAMLSMHPYGCRVIQRVLEHCTDKSQSQCIVDEILQSASLLAQDQYGNYVTQHVLERGLPHERSKIIGKLAGQIVQMSQHKFASNVIEKCLEYGSTSEKERLIEEIVGQTEGNDNLLVMMKDQFANYVVQKVFETCSDKQRDILLSRIKVHLPALKKYTYGKHIVARVEQFCAEDLINEHQK